MKRLARLVALIGMLAVVVIPVAGTSRAWAASGDHADKLTIEYRVDAQGVLHAKETWVYRFGPSSGRHGMYRSFLLRENYDTKQDAVYTISGITVDSPDAPSTFTTSTAKTNGGRVVTETLKIGSATSTVSSPTATYVIEYQVTGAMRTFSGYDELYWDALSAEAPDVSDLTVTVSVPGGVQDTTCNNAKPGTKGSCTSTGRNNGVATYQVSNRPEGNIVTIGAKINSGLVSDNAPHLEPRADGAAVTARKVAVGAGAASLVASPLLGLAYYRRRGRDQRFLGVPPGVIPGEGENVPIGPSKKMEIPVAFSPPRITPAEGGYLEDGVLNTKETTATLIDLAVRGGVQIRGDNNQAFARLLDPSKATAPHERVLVQSLFSGGEPEVDLSQRGDLTLAHDNLVQQVRSEAVANRWFTSLPSIKMGTGCAGVFGVVLFAFLFQGRSLSVNSLWLLAPIVPIVATIAVVRAKMSRGRRTAVGRAYTDQVEGFRTYLATAEADQLRFEEGEDIYSKYLPWAIVFGLTERWAKVCERLVELGRLSAAPPTWYYGPYGGWNFWIINDSLGTINNSALPPQPVATGGSSGAGFGGGSSFGGGGGFAGGGGGGGGAGSW